MPCPYQEGDYDWIDYTDGFTYVDEDGIDITVRGNESGATVVSEACDWRLEYEFYKNPNEAVTFTVNANLDGASDGLCFA